MKKSRKAITPTKVVKIAPHTYYINAGGPRMYSNIQGMMDFNNAIKKIKPTNKC
jgi:hypothetical protein